MRKIVFGFGVSADCRLHGLIDAQEFEDEMTNDELDDTAWEIAVQEAERYGYYPESWRDEEEDDYDDNGGGYADIDAWWEEYDADKHDPKKPGGGSWF